MKYPAEIPHEPPPQGADRPWFVVVIGLLIFGTGAVAVALAVIE